MQAVNFEDIGRVPMDGDNVAIATRKLNAGTVYVHNDHAYTLSHTVLEGHRFAVAPISQGELLLSWGLPFGTASRDIAAGEYVCNPGILEALGQRSIDFPLPETHNFEDRLVPHQLDRAAFRPGKQVERHAQPGTFQGYPRPGGRGVGTRNCIVILGTTSVAGGYARALEARLKSLAAGHENLDAIVAVTHTEGGSGDPPNNQDFVLRTLSGFLVHPNIGAVLAVDYPTASITNAMLESYLQEHDYPLAHVPHRFFTVNHDFHRALDEGEAIVRGWLDPVNATPRSAQPLRELKIALQCGGSDAFSGVAGNPLAGWVAKEVIKHGGSANLAETDELIGAEAYILGNTRDLATAETFLKKIEVFKERAAWHGHSAEGNPSGGNKFRGLYNIAIKSIGAARKKDPEVQLDYVIDYGQRMSEPGYYFMDSPGNDLESIAGQVASGANMIFFITGNGSVTNFPFVPTIKYVTTSGRYQLMSKDMDVNAGRYQDGTPMDELGRETFDYTCRVASGLRSFGERAGHAQVSIWRDWRQTDGSRLAALQQRAQPTGRPIPIRPGPALEGRVRALATPRGAVADQVGLVLPTSLCSAQIARMIADGLNAKDFAAGRSISRFVSLVHTEGCGSIPGKNEQHYTRTVVGHLIHPFVREALILEHGCEVVHNDAMHRLLEARGIDTKRFGWASVQMDGGIEAVSAKAEAFFAERLPQAPAPAPTDAGLDALSLGLTSVRPVPDPIATALGRLTAGIVQAGGTMVLAENASLLRAGPFVETLTGGEPLAATVPYGEPVTQPGLHVMAAPTAHAVETLSGMGGTGVQVMLAHVAGAPLQGHPMIPLVQVSGDPDTLTHYRPDLDGALEATASDPDAMARALLELVLGTVARTYVPKLWTEGNTDFQVTRGFLGLSL